MSGNRACLYFCQAFSMGRWVNPLRSSAGFRFCCCYSYPQCTTSFKLTSLVSLCLCGELLCKSVFRNVCSTLSFKSSFALCQRGSLYILLPPCWPLMLLLVTPHWFTWWWAEGGGSVLCYEYALISARPCVSLSNHSCGSGLRMSSFASHPTPGIEDFFCFFLQSASLVFTSVLRVPGFFALPLELLGDGEEDLGGALCFSCGGRCSLPSGLLYEGALSEFSPCPFLSLSEHQSSGGSKTAYRMNSSYVCGSQKSYTV